MLQDSRQSSGMLQDILGSQTDATRHHVIVVAGDCQRLSRLVSAIPHSTRFESSL